MKCGHDCDKMIKTTALVMAGLAVVATAAYGVYVKFLSTKESK